MAYLKCPKVLHYCSCLQCNSQLFLKIQDNYSLISSQQNLFQFYKWERNVIIFRIIEWIGKFPVKPTLQLNFFLNWSSGGWITSRAKALSQSSESDLLSLHNITFQDFCQRSVTKTSSSQPKCLLNSCVPMTRTITYWTVAISVTSKSKVCDFFHQHLMW